MPNERIVAEALALPLTEKVRLAQSLWQNIDRGLEDVSESEAVSEALQRDGELSANVVPGRPHDEVMRAARQAVGCD